MTYCHSDSIRELLNELSLLIEQYTHHKCMGKPQLRGVVEPMGSTSNNAKDVCLDTDRLVILIITTRACRFLWLLETSIVRRSLRFLQLRGRLISLNLGRN